MISIPSKTFDMFCFGQIFNFVICCIPRYFYPTKYVLQYAYNHIDIKSKP